MSFFLFLFSAPTVGAHQHSKPSVETEFLTAETANSNNFTQDLMSELGSKALFSAKILGIDNSSLVISENTSHFRLKNQKDICRQTFIKETLYFVHTKCYRGHNEIFNFLKAFPL